MVKYKTCMPLLAFKSPRKCLSKHFKALNALKIFRWTSQASWLQDLVRSYKAMALEDPEKCVFHKPFKGPLNDLSNGLLRGL
jgi:hypothetical protein